MNLLQNVNIRNLLRTFLISLSVCTALAKPTLQDFARNIYSQYGEDGIIEKIFEVIGPRSKICVEFGASDGFSLSNTANLWRHNGWTAILIESHPTFYASLINNTQSYPQCYTLHRHVGFQAHDSIEAILRELSAEKHIDVAAIDFMSIDIDGNDYYVYESLASLRPRVIVCEYNPTFPSDLDIYSIPDSFSGCSVAALVRIAREKKYSLVALTRCNAFFVVEEELYKFNNFEIDISKMTRDELVKYIITDYAGSYRVVGKEKEIPYNLFQRNMPQLLGSGFVPLENIQVILK